MAKCFIAGLVARWGKPRAIITDKLRSYGAALRKLALYVDIRAHKVLSNRIEGSHWATPKGEKIQGRCQLARQAQRFLILHDETANLLCPRGHKVTAGASYQKRTHVFYCWSKLRRRIGRLNRNRRSNTGTDEVNLTIPCKGL